MPLHMAGSRPYVEFGRYALGAVGSAGTILEGAVWDQAQLAAGGVPVPGPPMPVASCWVTDPA